MSMHILFPEPVDCNFCQPACFRDLNLDRILDPVLKNEPRTDLSPAFWTPLQSVDQVCYRQEILRDLMNGENCSVWDHFTKEICCLADLENQACEDLRSGDPWRCHYFLYGHILSYGERYVRCITRLREQLPNQSLTSRGLTQAATAMDLLLESPFYQSLAKSQTELRQKFNRLHYCMQIKYNTIRVKKLEGEEDLSRKILSVFQKFQQKEQQDYRQEQKEEPYANHVEAAVLQCLSKVYPDEFRELTTYVEQFSRFLDQDLLQMCRDLRFYIDWLSCIRPLQEAGLPFCFPDFDSEFFFCKDFFDLALAEQLGNQVVLNDFALNPGEQILVITGPNQGGKTTFARAMGQLHYLASLGLCIPGTSACLQLTNQVLTHFEREESRFPGSGRLQDDLQRLHDLLELSGPKSFFVINEIFASTSAKNAVLLGKHMTEALLKKGCLTVLVTFLTELAENTPGTVSMMSSVDPETPSLRTYRILRKPPDSRTYAMTLADRHRLTYDQIMRRIAP